MKKDQYSPAIIKDGAREMIPALRRFRQDSLTGELPADVAGAHQCVRILAAYLRVLVVQCRNGGWIGDVLFQTVPDRYPDVVGMPDAAFFAGKSARCPYGRTTSANCSPLRRPPSLSEVNPPTWCDALKTSQDKD